MVGRLAARHGIKVRLRRSWFGGVAALVLLPSSLLGDPAEPPRPADGSAVHPADPDLDRVDSRVPMVHVPLGGHRPRSSP